MSRLVDDMRAEAKRFNDRAAGYKLAREAILSRAALRTAWTLHEAANAVETMADAERAAKEGKPEC